MNYQHISPLESAGLSDSQIAAVLSSVTARPVGFNEFVNFLDDEGLASRHPINREWRGTLPAIATVEGHPLQAGIDKLFSHLNKPQSVQIDTSIADVNLLITEGRFVDDDWERQPWCLVAAELLAGLVQAEVITPGHREGFYNLGGGLKHGVVTASQVDELRTQHQFASRVTNAVALFAERMQPGDNPAVVMAQAWEDAI